MQRVLVITSSYLRGILEENLKDIDKDCSFIFREYENYETIGKVYDENIENADGVLVSGPVAMAAITAAPHRIKKPMMAVSVNLAGIFQVILELLVKQGYDKSRIIFDFMIPYGQGVFLEDFISISSGFGKDAMPLPGIGNEGSPDQNYMNSLEDQIRKKIRTLQEQNAFDIAIIGYTSLVDFYEEQGINYIFYGVNRAQMVDVVHELKMRIELEALRGSLPTVIHLLPGQDCDAAMLCAVLKEYFKENLLENELSVAEDGSVDAVVTLSAVKYITSDGHSCALSTLFKDRNMSVAIGYGIATGQTKASANARQAAKEAKIHGGSFIKNEDGSLMGPLGSVEKYMDISTPDENIAEIAKKCRLSTITIQKLRLYVERKGSKVTAPNLADLFECTIRNANRIILNLESAGYAKQVYNLSGGTKGRPVKVYEITLK